MKLTCDCGNEFFINILNKNQEVCSFCGKITRDVKTLIKGLNGYICDGCVNTSAKLLNDLQIEEVNSGSEGEE